MKRSKKLQEEIEKIRSKLEDVNLNKLNINEVSKLNNYIEIMMLERECKLIKEFEAKIDKEIKHIKEIMWCNAHDKGLLEDLIKRLEELSEVKE